MGQAESIPLLFDILHAAVCLGLCLSLLVCVCLSLCLGLSLSAWVSLSLSLLGSLSVSAWVSFSLSLLGSLSAWVFLSLLGSLSLCLGLSLSAWVSLSLPPSPGIFFLLWPRFAPEQVVAAVFYWTAFVQALPVVLFVAHRLSRDSFSAFVTPLVPKGAVCRGGGLSEYLILPPKTGINIEVNRC